VVFDGAGGQLDEGLFKRRRARQKVGHVDIGDQPPLAHHDDMLGGQGQLADHVAGEEHRPALGGQRPEQVADPAHALGIQAVDRLVEDQRGGIAEQRRGDPQPLPHAQGETAYPPARHIAQADQVQNLIHPVSPDGMGGGQSQQMVPGRTPRVDGPGFEQGADLAKRGREVGVAAAVDPHVTRGGGVQAENEAHRRRLARAVGAQEAGDDSRLHGETEIRDGGPFTVELGETACLDHCVTRWNGITASVKR
jgi:hypothetical protein